jgi:ketosteroid isomerase-like protein
MQAAAIPLSTSGENQERKMNATSRTIEVGIDATNRAFEAAYNRGDAAGAVAVYTTDGQALPPNGSTVTGHAALQSFWQAVMDMGVKSITLETVELQPCGECAYEVGTATLMGEGGTMLDKAKFIVVWQQEDGEWKWHRDIWNSNSPA